MRKFILSLIFVATTLATMAQITTSAIDGVVTDANGLLCMRARNNFAYSLHEKGIGNDYEWTLNYQTSVR